MELIEASSSKYLNSIISSSSSGETRVRDVIKLVAHRVVHGGGQTKPMAIWPGHEDGLATLEVLSEFAPLHVCSLV
jgi:acetate kinase